MITNIIKMQRKLMDLDCISQFKQVYQEKVSRIKKSLLLMLCVKVMILKKELPHMNILLHI